MLCAGTLPAKIYSCQLQQTAQLASGVGSRFVSSSIGHFEHRIKLVHNCVGSGWSRKASLEAACLWQEVALFTFQTSFDEVSDVQWWPGNATAFALVSSRGTLEVR